jgi:hypothetical protein
MLLFPENQRGRTPCPSQMAGVRLWFQRCHLPDRVNKASPVLSSPHPNPCFVLSTDCVTHLTYDMLAHGLSDLAEQQLREFCWVLDSLCLDTQQVSGDLVSE